MRRFTVTSNSNHGDFLDFASKFGSDKDSSDAENAAYKWPSHTYGTVYEFLFSHRRNEIFNVFECGVGTNNTAMASNMGGTGEPGASLRLWKEYFPNSKIIGADIDKEILFTENRIETFYVDQTCVESIKTLWNSVGDVKFDLMVDDGLHNLEGGMTLLVNSLEMLSNGGIYIIEDVSINYLDEFKIELERNKLNYFIICLWRSKEFGFDNNLILIKK